MRLSRLLLIVCAAIGLTSPALADDGYDLWLRYKPLPAPVRARIESRGTAIIAPAQPSPMLAVALGELNRGLAGLLGHDVGNDTSRGAIYVGTPGSLPVLATLDLPLRDLGPEGFVIRSRVIDIVCDHLAVNKDQVTDTTSFIEDIGADSLDIVELVMALEEEYEMEISDEDAEKIKTVQDVISYIEAHR